MLYYKLRNTPCQVVRGCMDLPHVGNHPGTTFFVCFVLLVGIAGGQNGGVAGFILMALAAVFPMGIFYAMGAWSRAELSDRISRRDDIHALLQAWVNTTDLAASYSVRISFRVEGGWRNKRIHVWRDDAPYPHDLPDWLVASIDEILTDRRRGRINRLPEESELRTIQFSKSDLSRHQELAAHGLLSKYKERQKAPARHNQALRVA